MKFFNLLGVTLIVFISFLQAQEHSILDLSSKPRHEGEKIFEKTTTIDPENDIFGHSFGVSEEDFIKEEGSPDGYLQVSPKKSIMIYGSSTGFIFLDGKLAGVRISSSLIDWSIANQMTSKSRFHGIAWSIKGGIRENTLEKEIQKRFGDQLRGSEYQQFIIFPNSRLDINFSSMTSDGKTIRMVHAILLMKDEKAGDRNPRDKVKNRARR